MTIHDYDDVVMTPCTLCGTPTNAVGSTICPECTTKVYGEPRIGPEKKHRTRLDVSTDLIATDEEEGTRYFLVQVYRERVPGKKIKKVVLDHYAGAVSECGSLVILEDNDQPWEDLKTAAWWYNQVAKPNLKRRIDLAHGNTGNTTD